jgi:hypothetical protein
VSQEVEATAQQGVACDALRKGESVTEVSQAIVQGPRSKDKVISRRPRTKATGRNCILRRGGGERVDVLTRPYLPRDETKAKG